MFQNVLESMILSETKYFNMINWPDKGILTLASGARTRHPGHVPSFISLSLYKLDCIGFVCMFRCHYMVLLFKERGFICTTGLKSRLLDHVLPSDVLRSPFFVEVGVWCRLTVTIFGISIVL